MSSGAGEQNGRGVKAIGMANAFAAVADQPWALYYNAAGLAQIHTLECSSFIVPSQFGLPELRTTAFACAVPSSDFTIALAAEQFGFDLYHETALYIGTGAVLEPHLYVGAALHGHRIDIIRYGSAAAAALDVGVLGLYGGCLRIGCAATNVLPVSSFTNQEKLPQTFSAGIAYSPLMSFVCSIEIENDNFSSTIVKAGIEEVIFHSIAVRVGVAKNPEKFSMGVSYLIGKFEFGYAGYNHTELGWTDQIEIGFTL
ncbi:MAG: hypothetical protein WAV76_04955 [Bacteroidota bacterium]